MRIEVTMTEEIFRRFTLFDMMKRRKVWRAPAIWAAILCTSAAICFIMNHVRGAVLLGWVLLLVGTGLPLSYFSSFAASMKQQILTQGLKRPQLVYTLELTKKGKGICVDNGREHADYAWKDVHHVYQDKEATYLFMTPARAFILPHFCIEEGEEALWELICEKIDAKRRTVL